MNTNSTHLPPKQRLILDFQKKLRSLIQVYPNLSCCMDAKALSMEVSDILTKTGFSLCPQPQQKTGSVAPLLNHWLKEGYLVLFQYHPKSADTSLITILRAIKASAPNLCFQGLIPVFLARPSSNKQLTIFKSLACFGIRHVCFLTPESAVETNAKELLIDLENFFQILRKTAQPEKTEQKNKPLQDVREYRSMLSRGEQLMQEEKYEEAVSIFTKAIALSPSFSALMSRGESYYKGKDYMHALQDFREANDLEKERQEPFAKIGNCSFVLMKEMHKKGEEKKAKQWFAIGFKHLKEAEKIIQKSIHTNNGCTEKISEAPYQEILAALVQADLRGLQMESEMSEVNKLADRVMEKTENSDLTTSLSLDAQIDHALMLARQGQVEKAESVLRKVMDQDSGQAAPALNNFAIELRKSGKTGKAFEIYLELLSFDIPDKDTVLKNMRKAGMEFGDNLRNELKHDEAIDTYKKILQQKPRGKEWVLCELAMTFLEKQDQAQASFRLMEAIYINPSLMSEPEFKKYTDLGSLREEMIKKLVETKQG